MTETENIKVKDYIGRINRAVEFITENLDKELNLAIVSKTAFYSPFHFHRIFSALTNETLNEFINRIRIEKSASDLIKDKSLTVADIYPKYGFSSNASFSKSFKKHYGISPTELKKRTNTFSKIGQINSKNGQKELHIDSYICKIDNYKNWTKMNTKIEVKTMPAINVAYVTHVGDFTKIGNAYGKLMNWAGPKGLIGGKTITVYHDDPNITDISKVRQSACVELNQPVKTSGAVNSTTIKEGNFAVGKFEIGFSEFENAWGSMMVWVEENGYKVNNERGCYEIYHNNFNNHPQKKCIIEICVPLK